jgi:MFS family permease
MSTDPASPSKGPWAPLSQPTFRSLWLAILVGNIGTAMHDVAAAWVMAERTGSALWVGAVQSATTLPVVLLALIAGTLADIVDRRKYLLVTQLWMFASASTLALLAHSDRLEPWSLLALTFAMGVGAAMAMPAQAATTSELVPRAMLAPAVALNSVSMNIARSIGPAIGGLVVAQFGASWAFAINALSFLGVFVVLLRWQRAPSSSVLPAETFGAALIAGLRYATNANVFRSVLVKSALFFVFASALPALLPTVVRTDLAAGPGTYGALLGCIGIGAITGALLLPALRARMDRDRLVLAASLLCALTLLGLAWLRPRGALLPVMLVNGLAWITILSSLQIAAQTAVPMWVRARALSLYIVVFASGMATGSLVWGAVAQHWDTSTALTAAAMGTLAASLVATRFRLGDAEGLDVAPSAHWPPPLVSGSWDQDRGPALITVEYHIALNDRSLFLERMQRLGRSRRRDGAVQWGVVEDVAEPGNYLEYFLVASWLEHLRQHDRVTGEEHQLQDTLRRMHAGDAPPRVRHFVGGPPDQAADAPSTTHADL